MKTTVRAIFATNFISSILLGSSLQSLWGTLNILQVVFFIGLIEIRHPANLMKMWVTLS
jgi:hypothetical protein